MVYTRKDQAVGQKSFARKLFVAQHMCDENSCMHMLFAGTIHSHICDKKNVALT